MLYIDYYNQSTNTIEMNSSLTINKLWIKSIRKAPEDQLYLDKSNLLFISAKRKVLHNAKHKFI